MANYPSFGQDVTSEEIISDTLTTNIQDNNNFSSYCYSESYTSTFKLVHTLNDTDKETLETFYSNNKFGPIDLYYVPNASTITNCYFIEPPQFQFIGPGFWTATSTLIRMV